MLTDSRHCWFDDGRCKNCGKPMKHARVIRACENGTKQGRPAPRKRRPRTPEEFATITAICYACDHYQPDPGICGLKAKGGCGACKDGAAFAKFKLSGAPCPDKPPRFEGTELVEISKTDAR